MYFSRKCKVTFICHGATIYSEELRFSDSENYPPLSELGNEEIDHICSYLKIRGVKNEAVYTSPSVRTVQSAKKIAKLYKKDCIIVDELKPRKCGVLNGLTLGQIEAKNINLLKNWFNCVDYNDELQAESMSDFANRIKNTLDKIIKENSGNRIIIVTHPEVIQAAICSALSLPPDALGSFFIRTGSATQISYFDNWASLMYSDYVPIY